MICKSIRLLPLIWLGFSSFSSVGQTLNFQQLTIKDGLPSSECYKVVQDNKGYVWVFTEYGIVKHNGARFVSVCTNLALQDQNAYSVFQSETGELYFANSNSKLYRIRNDSALVIKSIEAFTKEFTLPTQEIFQIVVDKNDDIYFASYSASYRYSVDSDLVGKIEPKTLEKGQIHYKSVNGHFLSVRTKLGFGETQSDLVIDDGGRMFKGKIHSVGNYDPLHVEKIDSYYLVACHDYIYKFYENGEIKSIPIPNAVRVFVDKQRRIWVGTHTGLMLLDSDLTVIANYLEDRLVSDICVDQNDGVWVTTIGDGVYYCPGRNNLSYTNTGLKQTEIYAVKRAGSGVFVSSVNGSCYHLSGGKLTLLHDFGHPIYCGDISPYNGGYLFGTKSGVFFKDSLGRVHEIMDPAGLSLYSNTILTTANDEFLSFGGTGIHSFRHDSMQPYCYLGNKLFCMHEYTDSSCLVGTKNGIYLYNYSENTAKAFNDFFTNKFVRKLIFDADSNLWIATQSEGVYILGKSGQVTHYANIPSVVIKDIDFFGENGLILSTNKGVYLNWNKKTAHVSALVEIFGEEVNNLEISGDTAWIASRNGLYSIVLSKLKRDGYYPIYISSVYTRSKRLASDFSVLNHSENDLQFNFDYLNYASHGSDFHFELNGPTRLSGNIQGNVLQIQNLRPGSYELRVFPYNGIWYKEDQFITKSFVIKPAFWQTTWFRGLLIVAVIVIPGLVVGLYYNRRRARDQKRNEINKLLTEYKLIALKAQLNPHFVSNALSAIQLLIDSGEVDKANRYIARFGLIMRYVLTFSDKHVTRLQDELQFLDVYVELEQLRFENGFQYTRQLSDQVDSSVVYVPPLITQPFIENAIWHGLRPLKDRSPQLSIAVGVLDDCLIITIEDNGVGRRTQQKNNKPSNMQRESRGTVLIQGRIDNLNQLYNTNVADLNIVDLYDTDSNPIGTRVELKLPLTLLDKLEEKQYESHSD